MSASSYFFCIELGVSKINRHMKSSIITVKKWMKRGECVTVSNDDGENLGILKSINIFGFTLENNKLFIF